MKVRDLLKKFPKKVSDIHSLCEHFQTECEKLTSKRYEELVPIICETERETERQRVRDREKHRERQGEKDTDIERDKEREKDTHRERKRFMYLN